MTKKEICEMCEEYNAEVKCDHEEKCKIISVLKENNKLKKENRELKKQIAELKIEKSYMINSNALGDRNNQMGW